MTSHRFQVTPVKDFNHDNVSSQPSEMIPLINIESSTPAPSPAPLPPQLMMINETNKASIRLVNSAIQRLKTNTSSPDLMQQNKSSLPTNHSNSSVNLTVNREIDESDSCYSTIHTLDTNSLRFTNKFLHELRLKRRELHEKGRHLSIDQRIALNRFKYNPGVKRAQDIFDVHFATEEDDDDNANMPYDIFTENVQEQIRKNIFYELDRQRLRQFHKQQRQLVVGRALLMFVTSLILFMSITLVYVVMELYQRANNLEMLSGDNDFLSMDYDTIDI